MDGATHVGDVGGAVATALVGDAPWLAVERREERVAVGVEVELGEDEAGGPGGRQAEDLGAADDHRIGGGGPGGGGGGVGGGGHPAGGAAGRPRPGQPPVWGGRAGGAPPA